MKEVTKSEFKRVYFELGGERGGWTAAYWQRAFEDSPRPDMRFLVEEPETPRHTEMWLVSDHGAREHRLFFKTPEGSDDMLTFPSTDA